MNDGDVNNEIDVSGDVKTLNFDVATLTPLRNSNVPSFGTARLGTRVLGATLFVCLASMYVYVNQVAKLEREYIYIRGLYFVIFLRAY